MSLGLVFAPAWPKAPTSHVIPLVGEALWVRAYGGPATDLKSFNPVTIGKFGACILAAETENDAGLQDARQAACQRQHLPPLGALEYLSSLHLRETANMTEPGFQGGPRPIRHHRVDGAIVHEGRFRRHVGGAR